MSAGTGTGVTREAPKRHQQMNRASANEITPTRSKK